LVDWHIIGSFYFVNFPWMTNALDLEFINCFECFSQMLVLPDTPDKQTEFDIYGKKLIYSEYDILKLLEGQKGICRQYGMFTVSNPFPHFNLIMN